MMEVPVLAAGWWIMMIKLHSQVAQVMWLILRLKLPMKRVTSVPMMLKLRLTIQRLRFPMLEKQVQALIKAKENLVTRLISMEVIFS